MHNNEAMKKKIESVLNVRHMKVKRICASCQHKCIENDGTRICALMMLKVEQRFVCPQWQMCDGLQNAGKGGGAARHIDTKENIIK